jgi:hypothetical protein
VLPAGGATGRCHGNSEPDCVGAGEGAGAGAGADGAKPPWGALVVEASCPRQALRNCGQVAPPVPAAAFAACHCAPHCLITLWFPPAEVGVSVATVSRILKRLGLNRLSALEPAEPVRRYERVAPGEIIPIDIKNSANSIASAIASPATGPAKATPVGSAGNMCIWRDDQHLVKPGPLEPDDPLEELIRIVNEAQDRDARDERRLSDPKLGDRPFFSQRSRPE